MRQLTVSVDDLILTKEGDYENIVRGSDNYLVLYFRFNQSWSGRRKVVNIKDVNDNEYNCLIGETNRIKIPKEVTQTSRMYVTVYGKEGSQQVNTTTLTIEQL